MKYCKNCGNPLPDNAKFCGKCGNPVIEEENSNLEQKNAQKPQKKSRKKLFVILGIVIVLAAIVVAVCIVTQNKKRAEEYKNYITMAEKYVEELDYEQAETSYLKAIEVDAKQRKPYLGLAKVYVEQQEYDKAEEILEQADAVCKKETEEEAEEKENIKHQIEEGRNKISYVWVVEPTIEADDIYYLQYGGNYEESTNEACKQDYISYAVIQKGDLFGLIDIDGNILAEPEYDFIYNLESLCILKRAKSVYLPEYNMEWNMFYLNDNKIEPIDGLGGMGIGTLYYYNGGLYHTYYSWEGDKVDAPRDAFPILEAKEMFPENFSYYEQWEEGFGDKYAIYNKDGLTTDFIYDECGSISEGLLAVCQDGKWGYVDENGDIVIPMEYDPSWDKFDWQINGEEIEYKNFCYAASDGYVTLCKDGEWELRDTSGKLAIPAEIFEEILPVYEGKCWVKKDGKWGVIQLESDNISVEEEANVELEDS